MSRRAQAVHLHAENTYLLQEEQQENVLPGCSDQRTTTLVCQVIHVQEAAGQLNIRYRLQDHYQDLSYLGDYTIWWVE
jgi:hypothetical protein